MATATRASSREKVNAYRSRMKDKGLRLIQLWVADTRSIAFRRRARRDGLAVANSRHAKTDQEFVDAISAWDADE
jgi:hypothetical protein